ncbi:hypothetical protein C922_05471 [Plasmodium inui San Antonio 1]|uniref:Uncharacterized protein n=1 Tax=Plasmodium inui San Antonio 1 TaxID=1237626 RepID=W7AFR9_9APIC|nr:hypothetical protein C922_05471 [Plasmodium inui San Antonio 1]EUD64141.1 hypothetical protein C922_05471 [Plasmodium inui San Antonio 1]
MKPNRQISIWGNEAAKPLKPEGCHTTGHRIKNINLLGSRGKVRDKRGSVKPADIPRKNPEEDRNPKRNPLKQQWHPIKVPGSQSSETVKETEKYSQQGGKMKRRRT